MEHGTGNHERDHVPHDIYCKKENEKKLSVRKNMNEELDL